MSVEAVAVSAGSRGYVFEQRPGFALHRVEEVLAEAFDDRALVGRQVEVFAVGAQDVGDAVGRDIPIVAVSGQHSERHDDDGAVEFDFDGAPPGRVGASSLPIAQPRRS